MVAASVVGSITAFAAIAAIIFGLWYHRNKWSVWKKSHGEQSAVVVPVNVDMDVDDIPVSPPHLVDSQKEPRNHNFPTRGTERSQPSQKSDLERLEEEDEDDVMLFAMSPTAASPSSAVSRRVASPNGQGHGPGPMMFNDDDYVYDDDDYEDDEEEYDDYGDNAVNRYNGAWPSASRGVGAKLAAMQLQRQEMARWGGTTSHPGNEGTRTRSINSDHRASVVSASPSSTSRRTLGSNHREVRPGTSPGRGTTPLPDGEVDEAYQWLLHHFAGTPHHRQRTDNHHDDGSMTYVADDNSSLQMSIDTLTLSTHQMISQGNDRSPSQGLIQTDGSSPLTPSRKTDKRLPPVIRLSERSKAAISQQRENTRTKGKVQPMATDMDENTIVHRRSSKRVFIVTEPSPNKGDSSVVSALEFNGSDDDSLVSFAVKDSTIDQVPMYTYSIPQGEASEEQMREIRRKIREKKALLHAAKESSKGRGLLPPNTCTNTTAEIEEGKIITRGVVSPRTWF